MGDMRPEWVWITLEVGTSPRRGGKMGGALAAFFALEELVHELLVPDSIAGGAFASAVRGLMHKPIHSRRDGVARKRFYSREILPATRNIRV